MGTCDEGRGQLRGPSRQGDRRFFRRGPGGPYLHDVRFTTTLASRGGLSSPHPPPRSCTSSRDSQPFSRCEHHRTPVFKKHGFTVVTQLHPMTAGVPMTNLRMTKMLASARRGLPPKHMVTASTFAACSFGRKSDVGRADARETAVERASGDPHQCRSTGPLTADGAPPNGNAPSPKLSEGRLGNSNYYLWIAVASAWESSTAANSGLSS